MKRKAFVIPVFLVATLIAASCNFAGSQGAPRQDDDSDYGVVYDEYEDCTFVSPALVDRSDLVTSSCSGNPAKSFEVPHDNAAVTSQTLFREGYTVSYNKDTRCPNWVAWHLTDARTKGPANRKDYDFHEDGDVSGPRACDDDYYNKGYDRGHMCPAADNKYSELAMEQSFLFTNVCPQNSNLNRGDWNDLEQVCRTWATTYGDLYIVAGPIYTSSKPKTIGKNKVAVPDAFFKVVLRTGNDAAAIGFICRNAKGNNPLSNYVVTVDAVEELTGIDFFPALSDDVEAAVEARANFSQW